MLSGHILGAHTQTESRFVLAQSISGLPHLQSFHMKNRLINLQGRKRNEKKREQRGEEGDWIN